MLSLPRYESGDEELTVLPMHTKVVVTGNNRTKSVLVGLQGVVKKAVGLGSWHWLICLATDPAPPPRPAPGGLPRRTSGRSTTSSGVGQAGVRQGRTKLSLLKSKAVVVANLSEKESFNELQVEIQRQILQAQTDIEDLKKQLEQSKIERQHKEKCEAIRKLISSQPPRSETEKFIANLEKEIANLEAESAACTRTLELRKKQFALFLLHVVVLSDVQLQSDVQRLGLVQNSRRVKCEDDERSNNHET
ncbi:hypothetical protein ZWY2020_041390 [Hordeum vulgare]|nr:hypothetical protein ZWY2020_041390 [Hordeum vulgare]